MISKAKKKINRQGKGRKGIIIPAKGPMELVATQLGLPVSSTWIPSAIRAYQAHRKHSYPQRYMPWNCLQNIFASWFLPLGWTC